MSARAAVDPRGPRFAAIVTTIVLAVVLLTGWWPLLAAQTVVFAIGAFIGLKPAPYSVLYRLLVAPRLKPTSEREDAAPLRFAQTVGFVFALVGTIGYAAGVPALGIVATAFALFAAFLNAAFGFCLGCELYLLGKRLSNRTEPAR
ncbi:hypothetical protein BAY61_30410 [Prauserella marina]|uniref:Uncharacterized protein n=1 Tax=Prauserella marina TaxID=530584 RepID=A0A222VXE4_9PSEU|nr:DUF4395 domain-containing protein [Prauserella marina]ASR38595.1 hypothetical protein BAY61_30410 [Prauserella marina]PWV81917.1 uncharacterized protein DUF4395 [Prauserella marina]SDD15277.1 protein of unknown function [Prauserella marina]